MCSLKDPPWGSIIDWLQIPHSTLTIGIENKHQVAQLFIYNVYYTKEGTINNSLIIIN